MNSYKSALKKLNQNKLIIKNEKIDLTKALNRISALEVISPVNYPSSNNTAFDGFAINSKETKYLNNKRIKKFKIIKTLAAGDNPKIKKVPKFSTIEVMTGAIIEKPFDTIIPIEKIKFFPNKVKPKFIILKEKIKKNQFIRFAGSDFKKGSKVIKKGQLINPSHILALKTLSIKKILVKKKINIVFYSTGNEISNRNIIPNWKIRNSNNQYIKSFLKFFPANFIEKTVLKDNDLNKFKNEIKKNLKSNANIIITSGGVSAGKFDFIPKVINNFKKLDSFKSVAARPGKPLMFMKFKSKDKVFFGLPGNPISSVACFRFFIIPFLFASMESKIEKPIMARLKNTFVKNKKFTRFIKGKLSISNKGLTEFKVFEGQESFKIKPFANSNCWALFSDKKSIFKKGELVACYSLSGYNELFIK